MNCISILLCVSFYFIIEACIEYLHAKGYIHRDLKPENFMLMEDMRPKLGDFGCVRILGEHVQYPGAWFTGTPQFMAPEAISNCREITNYPAVDVWSLGPLLYFLLTSKHAFQGKSEYLIFQKVTFIRHFFAYICRIENHHHNFTEISFRYRWTLIG